MARVYRSLDEFASGIVAMVDSFDRATIEALRKTRKRMDNALDNARRRIGYLDRVGRATGYGTRAGARVGHHSESTLLGKALLFKGGGPWSLVDNSVSGGPTRPHFVGPRPDRNRRPLTPAKIYKPATKDRDGYYSHGHVVGSARRYPYWANAIESVQPRIIKLVGAEFDRELSRF